MVAACAGLADRGHAGANWKLAGYEVGTACRATRLCIVVGKTHAFGGELVEVRRPPGHHTLVVGADIPHADVITHDDNDVGLLRLLRLCGYTRTREQSCGGQGAQAKRTQATSHPRLGCRNRDLRHGVVLSCTSLVIFSSIHQSAGSSTRTILSLGAVLANLLPRHSARVGRPR
jgi:hypothetical protein